jgi:hypothetical protein
MNHSYVVTHLCLNSTSIIYVLILETYLQCSFIIIISRLIYMMVIGST